MTHDVVFVGGGLAALLFLRTVRERVPARVAIVDVMPVAERPPVHWSFWSTGPTPYDRFALHVWRRARVGEGPSESIAPYTLSVVRSVDVLSDLAESVSDLPIDWVAATARTVKRTRGGRYVVATTAGTLSARWVFDSACEVSPVFPCPRRPSSTVGGVGLRVRTDRAVFDPTTATLFDPIDNQTFAYVLPLSPTEALLESASFGSAPRADDSALLLTYLAQRHPGVPFAITHAENGVVPLGFAPARTAGPRHILLGTKRGLVKPSAGYGVVRIARETELLAQYWLDRRQVPPTRRPVLPWRLVDERFLSIAAHDPSGPLALLGQTMRSLPVVQALRLIDEDLPLRELVPLLRTAAPALPGRLRDRVSRVAQGS